MANINNRLGDLLAQLQPQPQTQPTNPLQLAGLVRKSVPTAQTNIGGGAITPSSGGGRVQTPRVQPSLSPADMLVETIRKSPLQAEKGKETDKPISSALGTDAILKATINTVVKGNATSKTAFKKAFAEQFKLSPEKITDEEYLEALKSALPTANIMSSGTLPTGEDLFMTVEDEILSLIQEFEAAPIPPFGRTP